MPSIPLTRPAPAEIKALQDAAPPMVGGEYLNAALLQNFWIDLDGWVRKEIASSGLGLSGWMKKHAPIWQQVGRVCFHLAENKSDPKFPFAFLATYAPRLSRAGQVQYQPLGRALQEYAGQRNKKALISLLSPVQAASEKSPFIRKLVDSRQCVSSSGLVSQGCLPFPPGRPYPGGERPSGAASGLVAKASQASRGRHHGREEAKPDRRGYHAGLQG